MYLIKDICTWGVKIHEANGLEMSPDSTRVRILRASQRPKSRGRSSQILMRLRLMIKAFQAPKSHHKTLVLVHFSLLGG